MAQAANKNIDNASGQVVRLDIENTLKTVATHNFGPRNSAGTILPCEFLADDTTNKLLIRKSSGGDQANPNPSSGTAATFFEVGDLDVANLGLLPKTGGTLTGALQLPSGSQSTPSLNVGDSGTGLFKPSSNVIAVTADGTKKLAVNSTATEFSGNATNGAKIRLNEATNNGNSYIELRAANSISSNLALTLPPSDGTSGQAIITNGSGTLTFGAPTVGAANLTGNTLASGVTSSSLSSFSGNDFGFNTTPGGTPATKNVFLAIGDSDTGVAQDGDGQLEIWANNQEIINFNTSGITTTKNITANTFSGSGASLTNLPSSALTGALPAVDGSALTGLSTAVVAIKHARQTSDFVRPTGNTSYGTATNLDITLTVPSSGTFLLYYTYNITVRTLSSSAEGVSRRGRVLVNGSQSHFFIGQVEGGVTGIENISADFQNEGFAGSTYYSANDSINIIFEVRNLDSGTGNRTQVNSGSFITVFLFKVS